MKTTSTFVLLLVGMVAVKDSRKCAATGGWGFGDFINSKAGSEKLMQACFACHRPARDHDFVFTRYAP